MAKELIISANVYEKKVALIEDGVVTEFYVERRDENQGVVGNLYKGRVMKVLPGMQSAFVDIGLERDAFLYVSDFTEFMEDEEEVDFKDVSESASAPRQPEERGRRDRRDREPPPPRPDRRGEVRAPATEARETAEVTEGVEGGVAADLIEQLAEIADESILPQPQPDDELETAEATEIEEAEVTTPADIKRGISWVDRESTQVFERIADDDIAPAVEEASIPLVTEEPTAEVEAAAVGVVPDAGEAEAAEGTARRSRSRKKAAETEPAPKASRRAKKPVKAETEEEPTAAPAKSAGKATKEAGKRGSSRKKKADAATESPTEGSAAPAFERIEDEFAGGIQEPKPAKPAGEEAKAAAAEKPQFQPEPEPEWRVGSIRSQSEGGSGFQRIADENSDEPAGREKPREEKRGMEKAGGDEAAQDQSASADSHSSFDRASDAVADVAPDRFQGGQIAEPATDDGERLMSFDAGAAGESSATEEDREASVRDYPAREEFAVRRGGRGRRRPPRRDQKDAGAPPAPAAEGEAEEEAVAAEPEAPATKAEKPEKVEARQTETRQAETRPPDSRRQPPRPPEHRQSDRRPPEHRRTEPSSRRERGGPPTISDLLREGQEVLVQIAKEPIAKKGARITSHIALPGRFLVYMPTVNHIGVSRKIPSDAERVRLKRVVVALRDRESAPGGFIARTACAGTTEQELHDDMRYLIRTWNDVRKKADRAKPPSMVHRDLDLVQRILRDQLADDFSVIRVDNEVEYARIVEFVNRVQPRLVNRVKLYTGSQPILEKYNVQPEIDKAVKPRVWLKSGGYIVINQTEALVAIDVNTGKFVGKSDKLEDTITKTNLEAAKEIVRQVRLRDLGGIIVVDFIDMEERKNRQKVMQTLQEALLQDRSPSKILSINDFGLLAITRKRVKQSLERTLCAPCPYCQGGGMVKSAQTMCFEILEQAKAVSPQVAGSSDVLLRVSPVVAEALHTTERQVFEEIEAYFGTPVTIEADYNLHQEQFDFAVA